MNLRNIIVSRLAIIYFALLLMSILIIGKIVAVQNIRTDRWEQIADNLTNYTVSFEPTRAIFVPTTAMCWPHRYPGIISGLIWERPELRRFMLHKGIPLP